MAGKPAHQQLGITERAWEGALVAWRAGLPAADAVAALRLSGATEQRARILLKNLPRDNRSAEPICVEDALDQLATIRAEEIHQPLVDLCKQIASEIKPLVNELTRLEGRSDSLAEELATLSAQMRNIERVGLGTHRMKRLAAQRRRIINDIRQSYDQLLMVLDGMSRLTRAMTYYCDEGLINSGRAVNEIPAIGGRPRSERSMYRRHRPIRTTRPVWVDALFAKYFSDQLPGMSKFTELDRAARDTLRNRLTILDERPDELWSVIQSGDFTDPTPPR